MTLQHTPAPGAVAAPGGEALAAVTHPDGGTAVTAFPVPRPGDDTGLLRVEASGVCGTDLALVRNARLSRPTVLGHHVVGRIERVGPLAAARWDVAPGDLVAVQEYLPCHTCRWCLRQEYRLCERTDLRQGGRRIGTVPVDEPPALWGGNAQVMHLPAEALVHRLPASMAPARAVWLLPLANAFDWTVEAGGLRAGETLVVVGPGQHGLTCVVAAREADAGTIVVAGTPGDEERLDLARRLGADHAVVADGVSPARPVLACLGGEGADVVVNTSGAGPHLLPALVEMAGKRGRVVEAGLADGGPTLDVGALTARALAVVGARGRSMGAVARAIASLDTGPGPHPLDTVVTEHVGLHEAHRILHPRGERRRGVHTVIRPWTEPT